MKILFIVNDPPYGTERCFNAFRLALALLQDEEQPEISVFLMADAVVCANAGQKKPDGYYNLEEIVQGIIRHVDVVLCGTWLDTR